MAVESIRKDRSLSPSLKEGNQLNFDFLAQIQKLIADNNYLQATEDLLLLLLRRNLSEQEVQQIYPVACSLLPHIEEENLHQLTTQLFDRFFHFPNLHQEQMGLAEAFADKHLSRAKAAFKQHRLPIYSEAMHYYAKALQIAKRHDPSKTRAFHQKTSHLFILVIEDQIVSEEQFQNRLDQARRTGDLQGFKNILQEIEILKRYRCDLKDAPIIESLYRQAQKVLIRLPAASREIFAHFSQEIQQGLVEPFAPSATECATESYRKSLDQFRSDFETNRRDLPLEKVRPFQAATHEAFLSFFNDTFLKDAFAILGPPPCGYDLRAMGSLAREELCPYSDLEWMILIENEKHIEYFKTLAQIIELQIISLGETAAGNLPVFSCLGQKHPSGFHVDTGGNPASENLIGTPEMLARLQKPVGGSTNSDPTNPFQTLRKTIRLKTNNPDLFETYCEAMQTILDEGGLRHTRAIGLLKYRLRDYQLHFLEPLGQNDLIHIKGAFVELLYHPLSDLALYFNVPQTNTLDLIDALPFFTPQSTQLLKEAVSAIHLIRTRLHIAYGEQKETAYLVPTLFQKHLSLTQEERISLEKTYWLILRPFYRHLQKILENQNPILEPVDLFDLGFEEILESPESVLMLHYWVREKIAQRKVALEDHLPYYQKLSEKNAESLRVAYLEEIERIPALYRRLEFIPNSYGYRQLERRKRLALTQTITTLTTPNQEVWKDLSVKIESPALNKQEHPSYLKKEVLEKILTPEGDLENGHPSASNNRVVRLNFLPYDLHFKQQPSNFDTQSPFHPGKEQAVSRLMMRLFGHGVSFSELVSFTIYREGKKIKDYLVLISETVPGPTLADIPKEQLQELDRKRLSEILLSIPLVLPGDTREVNCIFEKARNENGEEVQQLVSIDSDVAWVKPVVYAGLFGSRLRCQLYTVLFSYFPELTLNPEAIEAFQGLKPAPLVAHWLEELIGWNEEAGKAFERFEAFPRFSPKCVFDSGTGPQILTQFFRLQAFLKDHSDQPLLARNLLKAVVTFNQDHTTDVGDFLYNEYLKAQTPQQLKKITGRDSSKSISMTASNAATYKHLPRTQEEQQKCLPEAALKEVDCFLAMHFQGFIFEQKQNTFCRLQKGFPKNPEMDFDTQKVLLEALLAHQYDFLNLSHCQALTDDILKKFIARSGPSLLTLDLRYCPEITDQVLPFIADQCPKLKELYLSHSSKIRFFEQTTKWAVGGLRRSGLPVTFSNLERLHLSHCPELRILQLEASRLQTLKIDSNPQLKITQLEIPSSCEVIDDIFVKVRAHAKGLGSTGETFEDREQLERQLMDHMRNVKIQQKARGAKHPDVAASLDNVGYTLCGLGGHEEALQYFMQALKMYKDLFGNEHPDVATSLNHVSHALGELGKHEEALKYQMQALEMSKKLFGNKHLEVASALQGIAIIFGELGKHEEELQYLMRALEMYKELLGDKHPDVATSLNAVGLAFRKLGKHKETLKYFMQALEIHQELLGDTHPDVATSLVLVGFTFRELGKHEEALKHYMRALETEKKLLGDKHPDVASSLNTVGVAFGELGKHEEALKYKIQALEMYKELLGDKHPDVASSLNAVGYTFGELGKYEKALKYQIQALDMYKGLLGDKHLDVASSLNVVGYTFGDLGKHEEALKHHMQALEMYKELLGDKHPDVATTLHHVGFAFEELGKYEKALEYQTQALEMRKELLGDKHLDVASSLHRIGCTFGELGKHEKALKYKIQALEMRKELLGYKHLDVAISLSSVGFTFGELSKHEEAIKYQMQGLEINQTAMPNEHPCITVSLNRLGNTLRKLEKYKEALEQYNRAFSILQKFFKQDHPDVATNYIGLGRVFEDLKDDEQALNHFRKGREMFQNLFASHPDLGTALGHLGRVLGKVGEHQAALIHLQEALSMTKSFLGEKHPAVADILYDMGIVLIRLERYEEAITYLKQTLDIRKECLGNEHPDVALSLSGIEFAYAQQKNYGGLDAAFEGST